LDVLIFSEEEEEDETMETEEADQDVGLEALMDNEKGEEKDKKVITVPITSMYLI
jgi:hypothetical protein